MFSFISIVVVLVIILFLYLKSTQGILNNTLDVDGNSENRIERAKKAVEMINETTKRNQKEVEKLLSK